MSPRPIHPGKMLRERMTELGVNVRETAKRLGVSRPHLQNVLACRRAISAQMAVRLERALGRSAEDWLSLQIDYDIYQARLCLDGTCDEEQGPVGLDPAKLPVSQSL